MKFNENLKDQAIEIIKRNIHCPNTTCSDCVYKEVTGSAKGCNPDAAKKAAEKYLEEFSKELTKEN